MWFRADDRVLGKITNVAHKAREYSASLIHIYNDNLMFCNAEHTQRLLVVAHEKEFFPFLHQILCN